MNEWEISIYLTLLETPHLLVTDIARKTGLHRPMVYKILRSLESEWYIDKSLTDKRYYYHTTWPDHLREKLRELSNLADRMIPELTEIHGRTHAAPVLSIREWIEGIQSIHQDLLDSVPKWGLYYRYSSSRREYSGRSIYVPEDYFDRQKSKELERVVITSEALKKYRENNPNREVLVIPKSFDPFDDNITKLIYENKVAIIDYDSQTWWIIENERFARYEEKIFTLLAKFLKQNKL